MIVCFLENRALPSRISSTYRKANNNNKQQRAGTQKKSRADHQDTVLRTAGKRRALVGGRVVCERSGREATAFVVRGSRGWITPAELFLLLLGCFGTMRPAIVATALSILCSAGAFHVRPGLHGSGWVRQMPTPSASAVATTSRPGKKTLSLAGAFYYVGENVVP